MSIGLRIGPVLGPRLGPAVGVSADEVKNPASGGSTTLTLSLLDSADPVITGGDSFNYTASVTNTTGTTATSLSLAITVDASLTIGSPSGTGWSIATVGQVVTCTLATLAGNATSNTITIPVTTGSSAVSASTTAVLTCANATTVNGSQGTTVNLVTKDATLGIYIPQTSTEFTNWRSRKGFTVPVAASLWTCQEASGSILDKIGSLNLGATGLSYQQTVTGAATKAVSWADSSTTGGTGNGAWVASGTGPSPASTSVAWLGIMRVTSAAGTRGLVCAGGGAGTTESLARVQTTGVPQDKCIGNATSGTVDIRNTWVPVLHVYDRTNLKSRTFLLSEQIGATYNSGVADGQKGFGATVTVGTAATSMIWACMWSGANAEQSDANWKAFLTAMGFTLGY